MSSKAYTSKPKILILCDYYPPGHESSGGMRTIVNTIDRLNAEFDFWVVTRYHKGVNYGSLKINTWNDVKNAKVLYIQKITPFKLRKLIKSVVPSLIYSNSFFSTFTVNIVFLRKFKLINGKIPLIIAPEGELSKGSLSTKRMKKTLYMQLAKTLGLYKDVIWKVTSEMEKEEVRRFKEDETEILIAPNMPSKEILPEFDVKAKPFKKRGEVRLVFLSRIHPVKNLKFLLKLLKINQGNILLDVYGLKENERYFEECLEMMKNLNGNVRASFKGEIRNADVPLTLFDYHFFVLPTLGESFGHVIVEALSAGCPLIISDTTPWRRLEEKGIGWDLPLSDIERWQEVLNFCLNMDDAEYKEMSVRARNFIETWLKDSKVEEATRKVLMYSLDKTLRI